MLVLGVLAFQGSTPDTPVQGPSLRIRGTVVRNAYKYDGKSILFSQDGNFELDLDPSGRWFVKAECTQVPGVFFQMGFDGRSTVELENFSGTFTYESDTNKTTFLTPETATAMANVYGGNEFPFDLWPPSQFAWLVLASFEYQRNTNHLGRIGNLFRRLDNDPFNFVLKVVPQFRKDWPHVLEKAEIFFDSDNFPKDPIGFRLPSSEEDFAYTQRQWEKLKVKRSGVRVGFVESSHPTVFGGIQLPSRYRLEVSQRYGESQDLDPNIDRLAEEMLLKITDIQEVSKVAGIPEIVSPTVLVKDYRFRKVDETTGMEFLAYPITDKRWKSADDPILIARSLHNMARSPRFGNTRNRWVKMVGTTALVLVFAFPLVRILLTKIKKARKDA